MIGRRFREYRSRKDISINKMAKIIGISQGSLSDIENENTKPSADTLCSFIRNTDVSAFWLMTGYGEMYLGSWEILDNLGLGLDLFDKDEMETTEMKKMLRVIKNKVLEGNNIEIIGESKTGKTTILERFVKDNKDEDKIRAFFAMMRGGERDVHHFYSSLIWGIGGEGIKLAHSARAKEIEARKMLIAMEPKRAVLIIDNADHIPKRTLSELIAFQQSLKNLSLIFVGLPSLPDLPHCKIYKLRGLNKEDILPYLRRISQKSKGVLPYDIDLEIFEGSGNFYIIQGRYLTHVWRSQIYKCRPDAIR